MVEFERFKHNGEWTWTRKDLKGLEEEYSLCHHCALCFLNNLKERCAKKSLLQHLNNFLKTNSSIWECQDFRPLLKESNHIESSRKSIRLRNQSTQESET